MIQVIGYILSFCSAIICALIAASSKRREKKEDEREKNDAAHREKIAKEMALSMEMMNANMKLTVGVAMALKRGHCNGEVEEGLELINEANQKYEAYHQELAIKQLVK